MFSNYINSLIFCVVGILLGRRIQRVTDPELAMIIMKQSTNKGLGVEKYVANPVWLPILSLESVDGPLWVEILPEPTVLHNIAVENTIELIKSLKQDNSNSNSSEIIDANKLAVLTLSFY